MAKSYEMANSESDLIQEETAKQPLNDVWIYDTILKKWHEIRPHLRI